MASRTNLISFTTCICLTVLICTTRIEGLGRRGSSNIFTVNKWFLDNPELSTTPYSECKADFGKVTRVEVVGCDGDRCTLTGGTNATFNLGFIPNVASANLKAEVYGIVGSIPIPFHIPHADACTNSGVACPLIPGKEYSYTTTIPVLKSYPKMSLSVKWELVGSKNQVVICVIIPAQIS